MDFYFLNLFVAYENLIIMIVYNEVKSGCGINLKVKGKSLFAKKLYSFDV